MRRLLLLALCVSSQLLPLGASAQTITWTFRHEYPFALNLAFYSDNRNHVWPSANRAWVLNSWSPQTITISCLNFEKVCYGAWAFTGYGRQYTYWGVGPRRRHACSGCCHVCDGRDTGEIVLTQGGGGYE